MLVTFGECALRLSAPGSERLETARRLQVQAAGPESNAAVAARRLGTPAAWVSRLPDSPLGRRVASELRGYDLDVEVSWGDGRQGLTFFEHGPDPRGDQRVDDRLDSAATALTMDDVPVDRVREADAAYLTGATPALSTELAGASARFLKTAADEGALTAFSVSHRPWLWSGEEAGELLTQFFSAVDLFVATEAELATVLDREGQPAELAHGVASAHDFEYVAIPRERTCVLWHDATIHEYPNPDVEVVDPSGRDDAFAGALVAALLDDEDPQDALKRAMAARALAATVPGAIPTVDPAAVDRVAARVERPRE